MGLRIRGQSLAWEQPGSALVTANLAERVWPGEDPIGKQFRLHADEGPYYRLVGVIDLLRPIIIEPAADGVYVTVQGPPGASPRMSWSVVVVRTALPDPLAILPGVKDVVSRIDARIAVANPMTMEPIARRVRLRYTLMLGVLSIVGLASLLLAAVGTYAVVAHVAGRRTREIGIRIALGARQAEVRRAVAGRVFGMTCIGAAGGLLLSAGSTRILTVMLHGANPIDPAVLMVVALTVAMTALLAGRIPAWRASRLNPVDALRAD